VRLAAPKVTEEMVIAIDPGDIRQKHAHSMEFLGRVRDRSEKEIGNGYPLCKALATDIESKNVIPPYCEAYSCLSQDVKTEGTQLLKMIDILLPPLIK
jgi:hypothetical protein